MRAALWLASALAVSACASPQRDKGGLLPRPEVSPEQLKASAGRRLALIIGVNQPRDESWPALRHAGDDARAVASALSAAGGRFEVELLVTEEQTRRGAILAAMDRLARRNVAPADIVVIYFSGHGTLSRDSHGQLQRFLVVSDTTRADVPATGLSVDLLRARFAALLSTRRALLLASCHSGTGKSLLPQSLEDELKGLKGPLPPPPAEVSSAVTVLSAAAWGQPAREDDRLGHDIYTYFLLEAVRQRMDRNGDGAVSVEEAHDHARARTYFFTGGRQTPTAESAVVGVDPIILVGEVSGRGAPELGSYDAALDGAEVRVDGMRRGVLPGAVTVPAGRHRVTLLKGDAPLADGRVVFREGERMDAALLLSRPSAATVDIHVGALALFSGAAERQVSSPVPFLGVGIRVNDLLMGRLDFSAELGGSRFAAFIAPDGLRVPMTLNVLSGGAAAQWPFRAGRGRLGLGPQLSFAYLSREFAGRRPDGALLLLPGLAFDGRLPITESLEATLGARASYALTSVDGVSTHLGGGSLWTGLAWRLP